jgi:hypothetical protein
MISESRCEATLCKPSLSLRVTGVEVKVGESRTLEPICQSHMVRDGDLFLEIIEIIWLKNFEHLSFALTIRVATTIGLRAMKCVNARKMGCYNRITEAPTKPSEALSFVRWTDTCKKVNRSHFNEVNKDSAKVESETGHAISETIRI